MLALGIETESDDIRKDMVKRLERQKIETAFRNMRDAGIRSFAFFIFGYPGETVKTMEQTIEYAVELDPDFANFYPAVPYPGTALYEKCVRDGLLGPDADDWSQMEYSYYLSKATGSNQKVVMDAINRAKRRFFLRPAYLARHAGDIARLAAHQARHRLAGAGEDAVRRPRRRRRPRGRCNDVARRREDGCRLTVDRDDCRPLAARPRSTGDRSAARAHAPAESGAGRAAGRDTRALLSRSSCFHPQSDRQTHTAPRRPSPAVRGRAARGRS